jgi:hypothetical protein
MHNWTPSFRFLAFASTVTMLGTLSGALYADETQRGLKSTIPVKPQNKVHFSELVLLKAMKTLFASNEFLCKKNRMF